ncbi:SDR family NAD(P)-dependent oxidoreductase [Streptomyces sp. NBC_00233]|uniref:SDR family NAD(P)-dependent oxidoreductase n=1 Tax=Streptomyces sp. NBC_00233 TaxID=2975686 RepID=UPI00225117BA|nr:SDR family NAD(P)-dependent oxidoreductase [Streptomyces sp. NBC_00233]MCX5232345.1 SDR family NAD(P)-dependent oxidoreductase [Streptomyces sp. NBC_00233]
MSDKVVLITGTSSGIGLAAAVSAARAGFTTVATLRDPARAGALRKAAEVAGVELDIRRLDVTDPASVEECVAGVIAEHGRLDAVVNNAGAGHVGTIENESVDEVRKVMEVNFFGVVTVTKAVMPHLRAAGGRLLTVTSVGGVIGQPFNEAYCAAKFAAEGFMESLAPVAATVGVTVAVIEPGAVASEFVANVGVRESAAAEAGVYGPALANYLGRTRRAFAAAQTSEAVGEAITEALTTDRPAFRIQTSDAARTFVGAKLADLDGSLVQTATSTWVA